MDEVAESLRRLHEVICAELAERRSAGEISPLTSLIAGRAVADVFRAYERAARDGLTGTPVQAAEHRAREVIAEIVASAP